MKRSKHSSAQSAAFLRRLLFLYVHKDQYRKTGGGSLSSEEFWNTFQMDWNFDVSVVQVKLKNQKQLYQLI